MDSARLNPCPLICMCLTSLYLSQDNDEAARHAKEREEEMIKRTLMGLNDMKIKFPGKTDEEAEFILDKVDFYY